MSRDLSVIQQDSLTQITSLMETHDLRLGDIKHSLALRKKKQKKGEDYHPSTKGEIILRLFAYLGMTLIFAGLGVFINTIWDDIGSLPRVIITLGSGFIAYLCGIFFMADPRLEKAAVPAHIVAFVLQPVGLFVLLKEYFPGDNPALGSMIVFGLLALQQGLTFIKHRQTSILLFAMVYALGFGGAATEYFDIDRGFSALVWGVFTFFITTDLHKREEHKDLSPFFYVIATALLFSGIYYYIGSTVFDPLALSLILSMLLLAVRTESKTLYVLSCLYLCGYFGGGPGGGWAAWGFHNELAYIFAGTSLILAGHWLKKINYISLYPLWMFIGTAYVLGGFYSMLFETPLETLYIGIAALGIYAAILLRSRAVLAASVLSLISFIVSFTAQHFADTVGWPLLLIFIGFMTLGAGFLFARLAGRIKTAAPA